MKAPSYVKWLLCLALLVPLGSHAAGAERVDKGVKPNHFVQPSGISLEQAADRVRRETGGRVLSASPAQKGGQHGYNVRVLLDGKRVKNVFVDAESSASKR